MPESFCKGLLIPVLKKPHLDPTLPKNYRPITIATSFSKLMEKFILTQSPHEFHGLQFGFVEERGTDMAVSLTHDVIAVCVSKGSPVYTCSLDAEGAFDALPHSILLRKAEGVIPDDLWAMLANWYARLAVQTKWQDFVGPPMSVRRGTRQGGLSSPFLFNLFYQDLVRDLNNMPCGLRLYNRNFNVMCYADDLLLMSLTGSGLQQLINYANSYICQNGLRFNASKTVCASHGDQRPSKSWSLDGVDLAAGSELHYLGVNLDAKAHVNERISACRRAFFSLQSAGLHPRGLAPVTIAHLWNAAVRPVLTYGAHCLHMNASLVATLDRTQSILVKSALGLRKSSHSSDLLRALEIRPVHQTRVRLCTKMLRNALVNSSLSSHFYANVLASDVLGCPVTPKCSAATAMSYLKSCNISYTRYICDNHCEFPKDPTMPRGVSDTCRQLLQFYSSENFNLLQLLLRSF